MQEASPESKSLLKVIFTTVTRALAATLILCGAIFSHSSSVEYVLGLDFKYLQQIVNFISAFYISGIVFYAISILCEFGFQLNSIGKNYDGKCPWPGSYIFHVIGNLLLIISISLPKIISTMNYQQQLKIAMNFPDLVDGFALAGSLLILISQLYFAYKSNDTIERASFLVAALSFVLFTTSFVLVLEDIAWTLMEENGHTTVEFSDIVISVQISASAFLLLHSIIFFFAANKHRKNVAAVEEEQEDVEENADPASKTVESFEDDMN